MSTVRSSPSAKPIDAGPSFQEDASKSPSRHFAGGALSLLLLAIRRVPRPRFLLSRQWISRLHNSESGIPYGIALAIGGLAVFTNTLVFKLAAA